MALSIQTTRVALNTSTGTQDITISGFGTPKGAMFFATRATSVDEHQATASISVGFTDGTRDRLFGFGSEDGQATSDTIRMQATNGTAAVQTSAVAIDGRLRFDSWITDGVRINIAVAPATAWYLTVVLFGGDDISNVYVGDAGLGTGTSAVNITDPGFQADLVFAGGIGRNTSGTYDQVGAGIIHFGAWSRDANKQRGLCLGDETGVGTSVVNTLIETDTIGGQTYAGSNAWLGTISANASGFAVTPSASAGSDVLYYMAIEWATTPNIDLIDVTLPTSGDYVENALSFQPDFGLMAMSSQTTADAVQSGAGPHAFSLHTLESGQAYSVGVACEDNVGTTATSSFGTDDFAPRPRRWSG